MATATPYFANVINTGKHAIPLQDGHGNSVSIPPTKHQHVVKILNKFLTWTLVPSEIKILSYEDRLGNKVNAEAVTNQFANNVTVTTATAATPETDN